MRMFLVMFAFSLSLHTASVYAGDQGVPVRARASDYQAQQSVKTGAIAATLAASIVPARQVEKLFTTDIAKQYVVIEMVVYPENGQSFEVDWFNFGLKQGDAVAHVEKPREIATPWPDKGPGRMSDSPVTVTTTTGVVYGKSSDSVGGSRTTKGVYESVGVTNDPRAAAPPTPPRQDVDPAIVEQRIGEKVLPEGVARSAVAGYLFFPRVKKARKGPMELQWTGEGASADLRLQEK